MLRYIIIYILVSISLSAQNLNSPIKILIEKIKRADPKDRRALINQLKIELRKVNRENRRKSMMELKRAFGLQKDSNRYYRRKNGVDNHYKRRHFNFRSRGFRSHR